MITLVTGGSGSGKSAYAESLLYSCEGIRYYIATMQIYDAEGEKKVERHRKLRAGKGFLTIESPMNVGKIRFACAGNIFAVTGVSRSFLQICAADQRGFAFA